MVLNSQTPIADVAIDVGLGGVVTVACMLWGAVRRQNSTVAVVGSWRQRRGLKMINVWTARWAPRSL